MYFWDFFVMIYAKIFSRVRKKEKGDIYGTESNCHD